MAEIVKRRCWRLVSLCWRCWESLFDGGCLLAFLAAWSHRSMPDAGSVISCMADGEPSQARSGLLDILDAVPMLPMLTNFWLDVLWCKSPNASFERYPSTQADDFLERIS